MKSPRAQGRPSIRELTRDEMESLLARNHVGRIAFSFHDRVDLEPVHYVYSNGWLHGRTSPGTKLSTLRHHPWVAFEVDEIEGLYDWQSVIVHGVVHIPDPDGSPDDVAAFASTLALVREIVPHALEAADPTPERQVLFRVYAEEVTGRASSSLVRRASAR